MRKARKLGPEEVEKKLDKFTTVLRQKAWVQNKMHGNGAVSPTGLALRVDQDESEQSPSVRVRYEPDSRHGFVVVDDRGTWEGLGSKLIHGSLDGGGADPRGYQAAQEALEEYVRLLKKHTS